MENLKVLIQIFIHIIMIQIGVWFHLFNDLVIDLWKLDTIKKNDKSTLCQV